MLNAYRVFRKELGTYFNSPQAYIFLVVFLIVSPALFFFLASNGFFKSGMANLDGFFIYLPWLFLFFCPAVTMRVWSEEKRSGTEELLMTMPLRDWEAVLGKFFSAAFLLFCALVLTTPLVYVVFHFADKTAPVDFGPVICGYIGAFLMGCSIIAIGCWASSITVNQIVAFIVTCVVTFCLIIISLPRLAEMVPTRVYSVMSEFGLMTHFISMYRGVLDLKDVVYYLAVIIFFLFLNVRTVESRKWK
jgi:ABC-2 type transport system permease protein